MLFREWLRAQLGDVRGRQAQFARELGEQMGRTRTPRGLVANWLTHPTRTPRGEFREPVARVLKLDRRGRAEMDRVILATQAARSRPS